MLKLSQEIFATFKGAKKEPEVKKRIVYEINETSVNVCEETVTSFGVSCLKEGKTIASVEDISTDREAVERLAELCNSLELDPGQLKDVAEDYIQ